jgi:peptidoglycan hydrolase-like protein with peptidoglycan-binding domain
MNDTSLDLSLGQRGRSVKVIQNNLKKLGFEIAPSETDEGLFGSQTQEAVKKFQEKHKLEPTGTIDRQSANLLKNLVGSSVNNVWRQQRARKRVRHSPSDVPKAPQSQSTVRGRIQDEDSRAFSGGIIRVFNVELRSENLLGETNTDGNGDYLIRYVTPHNAEINLRIIAYDAHNKEIASSPVQYCVESNAEINLSIGRDVYLGPSEFERLEAELKPLLADSTLSLAQLTEDEEHQDITFLTAKTGRPAEHIAFICLAHKLEQETQIEPAILFGLFRNGLPTQLYNLLRKGPEVHRNALEAAVKENIIPSRFGNLVDDYVARLTQLFVTKSLESREQLDSAVQQEEYSLGQLLDTVIQDKIKQQQFVYQYINHKGLISEFWKSLRSKPEFSGLVDDIQFTFQLATLTNNHLPLIKELQKMRRLGEVTSITDLFRFDQAYWKSKISKSAGDDNTNSSAIIRHPPGVPGNDYNQKDHNYSLIMARMIEDTCPTKFIARRLEDEGEDFQLDGKQDVIAFLNTNPGFDLRYGRLESYLLENKDAFDGISDVDRTKRHIRTMQCLCRVAPYYDQMSVLMKGGFTSAHAIARMGQKTFAAKYSKGLGGEAAANIIHDRALDVQATAITLLAEYGISSYKVPMSALPDEAQQEVKEIPEWSTLFGSIDLCMCEKCRSVLSPAAYFVDLLRFLKDKPLSSRLVGTDGSGNGNETVKDILFERRPEIGEIELSCQNTNTALPHVDLVNEILENAISPFAPFSSFEIPPGLEGALNDQRLTVGLINAFQPPLSTGASITVGTLEGNSKPSWFIDDNAFTYTIHKDTTNLKLIVVSRSLQTKGSASERGAGPQYINVSAYEVLSKSVFPWLNVPFDFWREEANTYLRHLGATRYQIMEIFLRGKRERDEILNDPAVAREYLGLSSAKAEIIIGQTESEPGSETPGIWNLWGFVNESLSFRNPIPDPSDRTKRITSGNWLDVISQRVDVFLQQSGLEYNELLDLLDTVFVNPFVNGTNVRTIQIVSSDSNELETCEIKKLRLRGFDSGDTSKRIDTAKRIMRFVRLWRMLRPRWTMRDLDRAIEALGKNSPNDQLNDILDDAFLCQISHMERLNSKFNLPVINMLAFWKQIDTTNFYTDHSASDQPRNPSLYAELFRNKSASEVLGSEFPENSAYLSGKLSDNSIAISNALKISASDFQALFESSMVIPRKPPGSETPDDTLNLENLSLLYRHSLLAKSLRLSILDYLSYLEVIFGATTQGTNSQKPFTSTAETLLFVEKVETIKISPLNIREVLYLLRQVQTLKSTSSTSAITPTEENIAAFLYDIRAGVQQIIADNTLNEEQESSSSEISARVPLDVLTGQKLGLLNWDSTIVGDVLATLEGSIIYHVHFEASPDLIKKLNDANDTGVYKVTLESLPPDISFPLELEGFIRYNSELRQLIVSKYLSERERILLHSASSDPSYQTALEDLFKLQDRSQGTITYNQVNQELEFTGIMTKVRRSRLEEISSEEKYLTAIATLFEGPRSITRYMRRFSVPRFYTSLAGLPASIQFPESLKNKVYFDVKAKPEPVLYFMGIMTEVERKRLENLSTDQSDPHHAKYIEAIKILFEKPDSDMIEEGDLDAFLTKKEIEYDHLFDTLSTSSERFKFVLKKLLTYLRRSLSEDLVSKKFAENLNLEPRVARELLTKYVDSKRRNSKDPDPRKNKSITDFVPTPPFSAKNFVGSNPNVELTRDKFPDQFDTYILLHKIATMVNRFQIGNTQLVWIFEFGPKVGWLNLNTLPIVSGDSNGSFDEWLRLLELFKLRDRFPLGEPFLDEIFKLAGSLDEASSNPQELEELVNQILNRLSENNRWNRTDLDYIVKEVLDAGEPRYFQDERIMARIWDCFFLINGVKMSAKQCRDLSNPLITQDISRGVRQSVRARYVGSSDGEADSISGNEHWFSVAKPLRDVLREKQRTALVDYLVAHLTIPYAILEPHPDFLKLNDSGRAVKELKQKLNAAGAEPQLKVDQLFDQDTHNAVVKFQEANGIQDHGVVRQSTWDLLDKVRRMMHDPNDLYSHFLIDVEMSPCMVTSRIKQAISSIQLFVQRSLMNLEESVEAGVEGDTGWSNWSWIKNYGVWEVNRMIFLYPENWIRPELRLDKSPFFKNLESKLMQSELTDEVIEDALRGYLAELDQVARLEIVGMYRQVEQDPNGEIDILHVFGRTLGTPHVYYYRRMYIYPGGEEVYPEQNRKPSHFSTWEKVDVDVEDGDHLIPLVWNRRLYLFWPIFEKDTESDKKLKAKIAWSEHQQNGWSAKKISSTSITLDLQGVDKPMERRIALRSYIKADNTLHIIFCKCQPVVLGSMGKIIPIKEFMFDGCKSDPSEIVLTSSNEEEAPYPTDPIYNFLYQNTGTQTLRLPTQTIPTGNTIPRVLKKTRGSFYLLPPHERRDDELSKLYNHSSFYMDSARTFLVSPEPPEPNPSERNWWMPDQVDPALVFRIQENYYSELQPFGKEQESSLMRDQNKQVLFQTQAETKYSNGETHAVLPSEVSKASPLTETKMRTDIENVSLHSTSPFTPHDKPILAGRKVRGITETVSESIRSTMDPGKINDSTNLRYTPPFMGFEQNEILFRFKTFYHPYSCLFTRELNRRGVEGLYQRSIQIHPEILLPSGVNPLNFLVEYDPELGTASNPTEIVKKPYPEEVIDFDYAEAYAVYNWELFFHIPLLIADRLSKNQRFEEAQKWIQTIFDPTGTIDPTDVSSEEIPRRYWRTKPFYDIFREGYQKERIEMLLKLLAKKELTPEERKIVDAFKDSIIEWRQNPFQPHLVARMRSTSYQKNVVMNFLDNLFAWAAQLFRRDTIESINEATQLYIIAAEILGQRPRDIPARVTQFVHTYNSLEPLLEDFFSNALIQIEELLSPSAVSHRPCIPGLQNTIDVAPPAMLYFCVPKNDKLLGYWDTLAEELYKIRNCMNIQGITRALPLSDAPIDPALLVKAAAAGVDIGSILNDINPALPLYRFNVLSQKASELCSEVKSLASELLATLEKKDAEKLALIRAEHETSLLKLIETVKEQQYDEEVQNQAVLRKSREESVAKYTYYQELLGVGQPKIPSEGEQIPDHPAPGGAEIEAQTSVKMIPAEREELSHLDKSESFRRDASDREHLAQLLHIIPSVSFPIGLDGKITSSFGGPNLGAAAQASANEAMNNSAAEAFNANMTSKIGGYTLRELDWSLQSNLAAKEIMRIDKQIEAAEIRKEIAKQELSNHVKQIQDARQVEDFMKNKYTNQELYGWMLDQISAIYFQSYQLAYDVAKSAETAYRLELGLEESDFINFGYWDSLKRGLLAGERLYHDIKRMEIAYLEQNQREYEITKHVSLSQLDPLALAQLKETGECFVSVPESLFDVDHPRHYFRRMKNVSLTAPCITPPLVGFNCTLTLLKSSIRRNNNLLPSNPRYLRQQNDPRFIDINGAIQSIVTSSGQNDSGQFVSNLSDERYLPFEGSGVISEWHIQLPRDFRQFNYRTISDLILHFRYTAREGGEPFGNLVVAELQDALNDFLRTEGQNGLALPISLRHEFPNEWYRFLNPPQDTEGDPTLTMNLGSERFPFIFQARSITINMIELFIKVRPKFYSSHDEPHNESTLKIALEAGTGSSDKNLDLNMWNGLLRATKADLTAQLGPWTMTGWLHPPSPGRRINPDAIEDILVIVNYSV